jgi:hypothetical protein
MPLGFPMCAANAGRLDCGRTQGWLQNQLADGYQHHLGLQPEEVVAVDGCQQESVC